MEKDLFPSIPNRTNYLIAPGDENIVLRMSRKRYTKTIVVTAQELIIR